MTARRSSTLDESRIDQLALSQPTEDDDAADDDGQCPQNQLEPQKPVSPRPCLAHIQTDEIKANQAEDGERPHQ
jgi:hypothetical protein